MTDRESDVKRDYGWPIEDDATTVQELLKGEFVSPEARVSFTIDLKGCARCLGDGHDGLEFKPLTHEATLSGKTIFTHWASCPTNGEPILLAFVNDDHVLDQISSDVSGTSFSPPSPFIP